MSSPGIPAAVRARLRSGLSAHALSQLVSILAQLLLVPVFLVSWGAARYGEWVLVSALPSALALADLGVAAALSNALVRLVAAGRQAEAVRAVRGAWACIALVSIAVALLTLLLLTPERVQALSGLAAERAAPLATALAWMAAYGMLVVYSGIVLAPLNAVRRHAHGVHAATALRVGEALVTVPAVLHGDMADLCMVLALTRAFGLLVIALYVHRHVPWFPWRPDLSAAWSERRLLAQGVAFLSFPVGNALMNQGVLAAIGLGLDASAVAQVAVLRSAARVLPQVARVFLQATEPEMTHAHALGDAALLVLLMRRAGAVAVCVALPAVVILALGGPAIVAAWTQGSMHPDAALVAWIALAGGLQALWIAPLSALVATNRHPTAGAVFAVAAAGCAALSLPVVTVAGLQGLGPWLATVDAVLLLVMLRLGCTAAGDRPAAYAMACLRAASTLHRRRATLTA